MWFVNSLRNFYAWFVHPYEHSPYSVASRVRIFVFLLFALWPTFLAVVLPSFFLQGVLANLFLALGITALVAVLLSLLRAGKLEAAVAIFSVGLALLLAAGHFTGDYARLNDNNVILINRLYYLGALNILLTALLTEKPGILLLLTGFYLGAGLFQVTTLQWPAMGQETRSLLLASAIRASFVFPFFVTFTVVLQRVSHRAVKLAEQARSSLEAEVSRRTADLTTAMERLQFAQKSLVDGEKLAALGRLSANVAHEVNTPLGAIHSSVGNVHERLDQLPLQFLEVAATFSPGIRSQFLELLRRCDFGYHQKGGKELKKVIRELVEALKARKVAKAAEVAESLGELGVKTLDPEWSPLLHHPQLLAVLGLAHALVDLQRSTGIIREATNKASDFIIALKRFVHHTDETQPMEPIDLAMNLDTVLILLKPELRHGITVVRNYRDRPNVLGHPNQLHQVWSNLVHNAIQAMGGKGTLKITIKAHEHKGKGRVIVEVEDTGPGIPVSLKERIFEPFFTTKKIGEGTGLGLKIVQDLVEQHHGSLEFDSEPGRTVFRVSLPHGGLQGESRTAN